MLKKQHLETLSKLTPYLTLFIACIVINALTTFNSIPVYYLPDLLLIIYLVYFFPKLDQTVSKWFFAGLALFIGYLIFSPEPPQTEFANNYLIVLKPFFYICILALFSRNVPNQSIHLIAKIVLIFYPLILLCNLFFIYLKYSPDINFIGLLQARPFFIFENNFEITFYLNCFIIVFFVYQERKISNYLLLAAVILLAGSRSGLLSFAAISFFYFLAVGRKQKILAILVGLGVAVYIALGRDMMAALNTIDRVQTLNGILLQYNNSFWEILKVPFGYGIYQKVPGFICAKLPDFAEWFTGNSNNCDPLMLQAFYTRALFEYGIYVTLLIPIIFFLVVKKETGWQLALIILTPITCVATSVGGFSNGLAFWGILICVFAVVQREEAFLRTPKSSLSNLNPI